MDALEILGYASALIVGISLGLMGGGGSILTVPIFVYLFRFNPVLATTYSLFVVGLAALFGSVNKWKNKQVDFRIGLTFAVPTMLAVYLTRRYLMEWIPDVLFTVGSFQMTKDIAVMIFFAIIMLTAAFSMIRSGRKKEVVDETDKPTNYPLLFIEGIVVGVLTGLVGAGGGFLIVPALVLLARLPMKTAVGTSLTIIAFKSLLGFYGDIQAGVDIDWTFLSAFAGIAIVGIFIGTYLTKFISGKNLKSGFGWFVLVMAIFILSKEIFQF